MRRYHSSSSEDLNDFSKSIGSRRHNPSRLCTWLSTTYSQFLFHVAIPPFGQDVIIMTSLDIPCSLWPVVASLRFTGNYNILHLNATFVLDIWWGRTFISGLNYLGSILNLWFSVSFFDLAFNELSASCSSLIDSLTPQFPSSFIFIFRFCIARSWSMICCGFGASSTSIHSISVARTHHTFFPYKFFTFVSRSVVLYFNWYAPA